MTGFDLIVFNFYKHPILKGRNTKYEETSRKYNLFETDHTNYTDKERKFFIE